MASGWAGTTRSLLPLISNTGTAKSCKPAANTKPWGGLTATTRARRGSNNDPGCAAGSTPHCNTQLGLRDG